ncbi:MAG: PAS domain S-box protein [bacterium]|nr:PAS domain S-box protein [bacterium]
MANKKSIAFHLDQSFAKVSELENYLVQLVESAGGTGGILVTWEEKEPLTLRSAQCGLGAGCSELVNVARLGAEEMAQGRAVSMPKLRRRIEAESLRIGLGSVHALVIPVMVGTRTLGMFCLLHPEKELNLRSPAGMYNLVVERMELVVRNAKLLQHLLRERMWFDTFVRESKDGVAIMDRDGIVIGINAAMENLSGWKVGEVAGRPGHEVFPLRGLSASASSGSSSKGLTLYSQDISPSLPISADPVEAQLIDRHNAEIDVEVTGLTVRDENGRPGGWIMTVRDIRQKKETERLGHIFLSAMSHELQTPLAVISGFAGLLSDPDINLKPEVIREKAALILDESERLKKMVRQMLEATSIQAGGITISPEAVDLRNLAERTLRRLEIKAKEKNISLALEAPSDLPAVWADPGRIEQVMTNLVENAIKHGAEGTVTVELKAHEKDIFAGVADTGPGVSPEDQKRIFGLFQRGKNTKVRGSGLGLFISKAIVEAHGGRIGVTSGPGGGALFYFTLPRES